MIVTEQEAKSKWCPFVRAGAGDIAGLNRYRDADRHDIAQASRCIGSACMAWAWDTDGGGVRRFGHCGLTHDDQLLP